MITIVKLTIYRLRVREFTDKHINAPCDIFVGKKKKTPIEEQKKGCINDVSLIATDLARDKIVTEIEK